MTAKEIIDQYNFSKERVNSLGRERQRILDEPTIKVTDYSEFGYGSGGGIEETYCQRIKKIEEIDDEVKWLNQYIDRVEKVFEWIARTQKEELDIVLYKYTNNKTNKEVAITFGYGERTINRKLKTVCDKLTKLLS